VIEEKNNFIIKTKTMTSQNKSELFSAISDSSMKKNEGTTGIKMNVATSYTSLRDVMVSLPHSSSSSSSSSLNTSWDEHNSIKNHLLKQAALAYLMSTSTDQDLDNNNNNNGCFNNLKCFSCGGSSGESGCFQWLSFGTLIEAIVGFFCGTRRNTNEEEDGDYIE
jgi:hypothetical protein